MSNWIPETILKDAIRSAREWRRWRGMAASSVVIGAGFIVVNIALITDALGVAADDFGMADVLFLGLFGAVGVAMVAVGAIFYRRLGRIRPEGS
jgi:hypothetical protein